MEKVKWTNWRPAKVSHGVSTAVQSWWSQQFMQTQGLGFADVIYLILRANMLVAQNNFWFILKNDHDPTQWRKFQHRGVREVKWCHAAANCKWRQLTVVNPSCWTKLCDFAGKKAILMLRDKKGLGSEQVFEIQAGWNERRAVALRTESRRNRQRDCLRARTLILPSCASIISKWDFSLIGTWAKMFN